MHQLGITTKFFSLGMFLAAIVALVAFNMPRSAPQPSPESTTQAAEVDRNRLSREENLVNREIAAMDQLVIREDCEVYTVNDFSVSRVLRLPPREKLSLPIYPGCENEADYEARVMCGFGRFSAFIESNRNEPDGSARERVVIRTVITADGKMEGAEIRKGKDDRNRAEALRIIKLLIERDVRWTPGAIKGVPSNLILDVPISFHGARCGD